jgi:hypothetical protein
MKNIVICTVLYNDPESFKNLINTIDFDKIFKLIVIENSDIQNREINKKIIDDYTVLTKRKVCHPIIQILYSKF